MARVGRNEPCPLRERSKVQALLRVDLTALARRRAGSRRRRCAFRAHLRHSLLEVQHPDQPPIRPSCPNHCIRPILKHATTALGSAAAFEVGREGAERPRLGAPMLTPSARMMITSAIRRYVSWSSTKRPEKLRLSAWGASSFFRPVASARALGRAISAQPAPGARSPQASRWERESLRA